jgi:hypothetical protein
MGLYEVNGAGVEEPIGRQVLARRADGSTASIEHNGVGPVPMRTVTLADGSVVWLIDSLAAKVTWPKQTVEEARSVGAHVPNSNPRPDCGFPAKDIVGNELIMNQETVIYLATAGDRQMKVSFAPGLGCEVLRVQATDTRSGKALGENRLLQFKLGEPDPHLFDLGANFAEVKPSELRALQRKAIGAFSRANDLRRDAELDLKYLKGREAQ